MSKIIWDSEREAVIKELGNVRFTYRSADGVAENTGLTKEKVCIIIEALEIEGTVRPMPGTVPGKTTQWALKSKVANYNGYAG